MGGKLGGMVSGVAGNERARREYERQHDVGKSLQRGVEADLQREAEAGRKQGD